MDNGLPVANENQNSLSVWEMAEFPHKTKPIGCSPQELRQMLVDYANSVGYIEEMCAQYHIDLHTFYRLGRTYPEIAQLYSRAQEVRAEYLASETMRIADDAEDDLIQQPDGRFMANMAAVRRSELRVKSRQYLMEKYNPDKYGQRTKVEQTSRSLHIHAHTQLPPVSKLDEVGLDGFMDIQRSMRYGDTPSQQAGATRRPT